MSFVFQSVKRLLFRSHRVIPVSIILGGFALATTLKHKFRPQLQMKEQINKNETTTKEKMEGDEIESTLKIGIYVEETRSRGLFKRTEGLQVLDITPDSRASRSKLKEGDTIVKLDGISAKNLDEYKRALKKINKRQVVLWVIRDGEEVTIEIPNDPL